MPRQWHLFISLAGVTGLLIVGMITFYPGALSPSEHIFVHSPRDGASLRSLENLPRTHDIEPSSDAFPTLDRSESLIREVLSSKTFAHVTHTHSSSADIWLLTFESLDKFARARSLELGLNVRFIVCINEDAVARAHLKFRWPWLEHVVYSGKTYAQKAGKCLKNIPNFNQSSAYVLHTPEDMLLTGNVQWPLVASTISILNRASVFKYF